MTVMGISSRAIDQSNQIYLPLSLVHNITIHEFALRLAGQTGDNFAFMSTHDH